MTKIVISGSFRKFYCGICETINTLESNGITVLSPKISQIINPKDEFVVFEHDISDDPRILEDNHLHAIDQADALFVYNPNGYVGLSAALEIGYAISLGIPIYFKEKPEDFTLAL